ncbi:MAG: peptidase M28, partial [Acidobacteriaceae bacterium]
MRRSLLVAILFTAAAAGAQSLPQFDGKRALDYTRQFVAIGPRWPGSPGHVKAETFIRDHFRH